MLTESLMRARITFKREKCILKLGLTPILKKNNKLTKYKTNHKFRENVNH